MLCILDTPIFWPGQPGGFLEDYPLQDRVSDAKTHLKNSPIPPGKSLTSTSDKIPGQKLYKNVISMITFYLAQILHRLFPYEFLNKPLCKLEVHDD